MAASSEDIRRWVYAGKSLGASHVLIVCDTFEWDDFPVYVRAPKPVIEAAREHHGVNMETLMECYDMSLDLEGQLAELRSWHGIAPSDLPG